MFGLVLYHQFQTFHIGSQIVACMLHVCSYTEVYICLCIVKPILPLCIVCLLFLGIKCRCQQRHCSTVAKMARDAQCTEICAEDVLLLTVKVYSERLHVLHRSERRLAIGRLEVVVIFRYVTDKIHRPPTVRFITEIRLVIKEVGLILAFCLQRTEQVAIGLVPYTMTHGQLLRCNASICTCP